MKQFRFAIAGTGAIAAQFAKGLAAIPEEATLYAAASRTPGKAAQFSAQFISEFPDLKTYDSYEELAEDPDVDAVYVANLNTQHKEAVLLFLKAGKPVLCEKPFALNQSQAEEMVATARSRGVFLMEAMWTRFLPVTSRVREWVEKGQIGTLLTANASFGIPLMTSSDRRTVALEKGGGALLDLGIYPISYFSHFFHEAPEQMLSFVTKAHTGVDAAFDVLFRYRDANGNLAPYLRTAKATVAMDRTLPETVELVGDKGFIRVSSFWMADRATRYQFGDDGVSASAVEEYSPEFLSTGYQYEALHLMHCVREGRTESPIMPLDETVELMGTLDALRREWKIVYPDERNG